MSALELLRIDRDTLINCDSLTDPATGKPIPGTTSPETDEMVAEYDAAIAEVEGMMAVLEELHAMVWGECPSLLNEDSGGCSRLDLQIRAILSKASGQ